MLTGPEKREQAVLALLDRWPWDQGGVVIGGYALAAYGRPRYSHDIDVVVPSGAGSFLGGWLRSEGFHSERSSTPNPQNFEAKVHRYTDGSIFIDLLVGAVRDRDARVDVPESWISSRPKLQPLRTLAGRTSKPIPVARIEAIWVLKLQAGRDQDISDLFALFGLDCSQYEIRDAFEGFHSRSLVQKLEKTIGKTSSTKLYEDSLSRLGIKRGEQSRERWRRFVEFAKGCIPGKAPE